MAIWQRNNQLKAELERQRKLVAIYRHLYHVQCRLARAYRRHADRWRGQAAEFSGGLDARLITDEVADELRGLRINQIFLAADTEGALRPLQKAIKQLSFLPRRKLRCYVLIAFDGETLAQAEARLRRVWELGAMPFAQLYQPPDHYVDYSHGWKALARTWSRPAAMKALMNGPRDSLTESQIVIQ